MGDTIEISIPVDAAATAILADAGKREAIGRIVSKMLRPSIVTDLPGSAGVRFRSPAELGAGYLAMTADAGREAEALEWMEGVVVRARLQRVMGSLSPLDLTAVVIAVCMQLDI